MKKKHCLLCEKTKRINAFGKNKRMADGLHCYCKPCINAYNKIHKTRTKKLYCRKTTLETCKKIMEACE